MKKIEDVNMDDMTLEIRGLDGKVNRVIDITPHSLENSRISYMIEDESIIVNGELDEIIYEDVISKVERISSIKYGGNKKLNLKILFIKYLKLISR